MIRLLSILSGMILFGYIIFAAVFFHNREQHTVCHDIQIVVKDSLEKHFVTQQDVISFLKRANLNPIDKPMSEINTELIENELKKNEMISTIEAYKTPSGIVKLEIIQKLPVLRVITSTGSYYIDNQGSTMPVSDRYTAHVTVASGTIKREFATNELFRFASFLLQDDFWNNQIEQIYVHPNDDVELIPRVGNHRIYLGSFEGFEEKLDNLLLFYKQVIPKMGWEKYNMINLKYKDQIVCTKK
ncbi:cell division protein FtsQ [Parabacteroides sp. OttesenSCG-928-G07]|nr:cell division protein FtsQ [Parabacteroides sp. OttesenSCG-928-G07]